MLNPHALAEAILNSEVWDLRTYKLLRSVPALDGTQLVCVCLMCVTYPFHNTQLVLCILFVSQHAAGLVCLIHCTARSWYVCILCV